MNINEQIGNFQEGTPLRTDISALGLGGCFRNQDTLANSLSVILSVVISLTDGVMDLNLKDDDCWSDNRNVSKYK